MSRGRLLFPHSFRGIATVDALVVHSGLCSSYRSVVRLIDLPFYLVDEGVARGRRGDGGAARGRHDDMLLVYLRLVS